MQIIDNILILLLAAVSFLAGKRISDSYHSEMLENLQYQLRLQAAQKGVGYVAPPRRKHVPIGQDFMDRLKENGRAIQAINNPDA